MHRKKNRGFTLIELMVTIAIIGILSTIVVVSLSSAKNQGRDAKRISDLNSIKLALNLYYNDRSYYPATLSLLAPNYLSVIPKDPVTGNNYFYSALGTVSLASCNNTTRFHIGAVLDTVNAAVLSEDWDNTAQNPHSIGGTNFYACATTPADFVGSSPDCGASTNSPDYCYDLLNN